MLATTLTSVEETRAAIEAALRAGMPAAPIGGAGDALPAAQRALAARQAVAASAAHAALDAARDRVRTEAAAAGDGRGAPPPPWGGRSVVGAGAGAPPPPWSHSVPPSPAPPSQHQPQLLPVPARLVPLGTRRCLSCRAAGRPGLLATAGGPAAAADATAAAVAHGVWYKRLSAAHAIVPRVRLLAAAGGAGAAGEAVAGGGGPRVQRLRVHNPLDVPIAVALVVAARPGTSAVLSAATFVAVPASGGVASPRLQPVGGALPGGVDVTRFELAAPSGDALACVVLHVPPARAAVGEAGTGGDDSGGEPAPCGDYPLPPAARDQDNPARSCMWDAHPLPAADCVVGDGFVEVAVAWADDVETDGASCQLPLRGVGVVAALPAGALCERTGAGSLPPAAVAARCTLVCVALVSGE